MGSREEHTLARPWAKGLKKEQDRGPWPLVSLLSIVYVHINVNECAHMCS